MFGGDFGGGAVMVVVFGDFIVAELKVVFYSPYFYNFLLYVL